MTGYQSARARQHAEGAEEQARKVSEAVAAMRPLRRTVTRRFNPVTQRYEEVR